MSLRAELKKQINDYLNLSLTSNDVDHYFYLFSKQKEFQKIPKRELIESIIEDEISFKVFINSLDFLIKNKPNKKNENNKK